MYILLERVDGVNQQIITIDLLYTKHYFIVKLQYTIEDLDNSSNVDCVNQQISTNYLLCTQIFHYAPIFLLI